MARIGQKHAKWQIGQFGSKIKNAEKVQRTIVQPY